VTEESACWLDDELALKARNLAVITTVIVKIMITSLNS